MRNTFINALCDAAARNDDVFLLCGDLGYSVLEAFAQRFPDRFLNAGIAEQNMVQVATGLAREGYNVFCYSIGNFPTLRCMEQIRYDVCYHAANVKIVAVGSGYAYGPQGVSHHTTEDIAMLRALPNMLVCAPADAVEARLAADFMTRYNGPGYVRLNKSGEPLLHDKIESDAFGPGKFMPVIEGCETLVLATGAITHSISAELRDSNKNWALWSIPFVGGYDRDVMIAISRRFDRIITVEEHQSNCGFGSSIMEYFGDLYAAGDLPVMPKITRVAIPNSFIGVAGTQEYLRRMAGLSITNLVE